MEDYSFWADFFDTYQSLSDAMKALWLIVPAAFVLGVIALILRHRVALRKIETAKGCDLVYTICRDDKGALLVYRHGGALKIESACVLLEEASGGDAETGPAR